MRDGLRVVAFLLAGWCSQVVAEPALTGPAGCRFAVPADLRAGRAEWVGPCAGGFAAGLGVLRVGLPGGGAEVFYGRLRAGLPVSGMSGSAAEGWRLYTGFDRTLHQDDSLPGELAQSPRFYRDAASAARVAEKYYAGRGNTASAAFYRGQAKALDRGPGE